MADSDVVTKTKVVILVKPLKGSETAKVARPDLSGGTSGTDTAPLPQPAAALADTAEVEVPFSARETVPIKQPELPESGRETAAVAPPREREEVDDSLVAAVIQVDLTHDPNPLTEFLGKSLLFRAARVAAQCGAPRLLLIGNIPEDRRGEIFELAYEGFQGGTVEVTGDDPGLRAFGRGRILLLDGSALHDPEAVAGIARARGDRTLLLLSQHGDGLKVGTADGRVVEVGSDVSPHDGVMAGACSAPVEDFELITRVGGKSALKNLLERGKLTARLVSESHSRQFRGEDRLARAERECFDFLASSGNDGLFEDLVGRPFARLATIKLLGSSVSPNTVSAVAGGLALLGSGLLALGHAGAGLLAAVLAILSAILDRTDGELARLRLDEDDRGLDFGLDHMTHAMLFLGLAYGVEHPASGVGGWGEALARLPEGLTAALAGTGLSAVGTGCIAAGGVLMFMAVLAMRGPAEPGSSGLRKVGDVIATFFGSRDYFYLLLAVAFLNVLPGMAELGVMGVFLLVTAALVHLSWVVLLLVSLAAPRT